MKNSAIFLFLLIFSFFTVAAKAQTVSKAQTVNKYENPESAVNVLSSYFDAVNVRDFRKAYGYWQKPETDYRTFTKTFENTKNLRLIVEPPTSFEEAGAGELFVRIPLVLLETRKNGTEAMLSGCYTLRKSNSGIRSAATVNSRAVASWRIYRGSLKNVPAKTEEIPTLLAESCAPLAPPLSVSPGAARVPGVISVGGNDLSRAVTAPAQVAVNEEFQISIKTSGDGCFSKGETSVVRGDLSADVFVYDLTTATAPGIACTKIFKEFTHDARIKFSRPGTATIRIWARRFGGDFPFGEPIIVRKIVMVR